MKKIEIKRGFTLAETLIALTVLGIIAAITIPALIQKQLENAARTKVKKAMTSYEKALNNMIIENDLKTNGSLAALSGIQCAGTRQYFKIVENGKVSGVDNGCRFMTADKVWWDISNINNPIIILKNELKEEPVPDLLNLAKTENDKTTFALVGYIDDLTGVVRINDVSAVISAIDANNDQIDNLEEFKQYLDKVYTFVKSGSSSGDLANNPGSTSLNSSESINESASDSSSSSSGTSGSSAQNNDLSSIYTQYGVNEIWNDGELVYYNTNEGNIAALGNCDSNMTNCQFCYFNSESSDFCLALGYSGCNSSSYGFCYK